jgi:hypothetical protein
MVNEPWQILAAAWEPYLGADSAEERARNAATLLMREEPLTEEEMVSILTRTVAMAVSPTYGGHRLSGSMIVDAVQAALTALAEADPTEMFHDD